MVVLPQPDGPMIAKNSPSKIHSLLLHNQNDALSIKKVELLKKLKTEGLINKIGVSIYDLSVLRNVLKLWSPDIVQVPINPFNHDFVSKNLLMELKRKKISRGESFLNIR